MEIRANSALHKFTQTSSRLEFHRQKAKTKGTVKINQIKSNEQVNERRRGIGSNDEKRTKSSIKIAVKPTELIDKE
jgi:hypothetical protein